MWRWRGCEEVMTTMRYPDPKKDGEQNYEEVNYEDIKHVMAMYGGWNMAMFKTEGNILGDDLQLRRFGHTRSRVSAFYF